MIEGTRIMLGGKPYILAALTFGAIQRLEKDFEIVNGIGEGRIPKKREMESMVKIVGESIRRNNPEVTDEDLWEMVDLRNARGLVLAVAGVSELATDAPGEASPQAASASPGETSTD